MQVLKRKYGLFGGALVILGVIIGLAIAVKFNIQEVSQAEKRPVPQSATQELDRVSLALSQVAQSAMPSVVNISTTRLVKQQRTPMDDLLRDPFLRRFFGDRLPRHQNREQRTASLGSGVIVSSEGHILTNNHVIENADKIVVTLYDKREFAGKLIGADPKSDLALVKIDADNLPALTLGKDNDLRVGDLVVAIGIPFGLSHTVTMGIVSAVGRSNIGIEDYEDFIQTDAAINPGNSGGALVNSAGELVGVNTAIFSTSGGYMGIGFAIPMKMVRFVTDSLIKSGKVVRGWIGLSAQDINQELADHFKLENTVGALVSDVQDNSPASRAGLQRDDVIVAFNHQPVQNVKDLRNQVAEALPDSKATITIIRNGERKDVEIVLGELQDTAKVTEPVNGQGIPGVHLQDLTQELHLQLEIPESVQGVLVTNVDVDSSAYTVLRRNDVIMQVDKQDVDSISQLQKALDQAGKGDTVLLLVYREGGSFYVTFKK